MLMPARFFSAFRLTFLTDIPLLFMKVIGRKMPTDLSPTLTEQYSPCMFLGRVGMEDSSVQNSSINRAERLRNASTFVKQCLPR